MKPASHAPASAAALASLALAVGSAEATVAFHDGYSGTAAEVYSTTELDYAPDVSASDLLNGMTPTVGGVWTYDAGASPGQLTDGIHGDTFLPTYTVAGAWPNPGATAEYHLGAGANGLGYDITSLASIAAWNSAGFGNQVWTLAVKPLGGEDYVDVVTVNYQPLDYWEGGNWLGATKVSLSDLNLSGVEYIKVTTDVVNGGANFGAFVWRELDVSVASTVPEPSAFLLLGLGGASLLRRRRGR